MKGVSLAIETIIVIILAVTVLTVLLYFFRSTQGPAEDAIKLLRLQTNACSAYVFYDERCTGNIIDETLRNQLSNSQILQNIASACSGLSRQHGGDYPGCANQNTASPQCIKECCRTFCRG